MAQAARSVDDILRQAMTGVMARVAPAIAKAIAASAAAELEKHLAVKGAPGKDVATRVGRQRRARPAELTRWVADRRARRVPNFVIEMTSGLDTKKKIVAKYGDGAVFEKGKPLPKLKTDSAKQANGKKPKEAAKVVAEK
jgi:hypothetical protein